MVRLPARPRTRWPGLLLAASLTFGAAQPASAAVFVGTHLSDVPADQRVTVAHPRPVQVTVMFTTRDTVNLRTTQMITPAVIEAVKASGLFSEVSLDEIPGSGFLSVTIDNSLDDKQSNEIQRQSMKTGATMGLAGSNIRDHYTSTVRYVPSLNSSTLIARTAEHDLITQLGLISKAPTDGVKVEGGGKGALSTMVRQIVANPLNALAADPKFAPKGEVTVPAAFKAAAEAAKRSAP